MMVEEKLGPNEYRMIKLSAQTREELGALRDLKSIELGAELTLRATLAMVVHAAFVEEGGE